MKDISTMINAIYLEKYDINVSPYLTYAQIQSIVTATKEFREWGEKHINMDMLVLFYATDIGKEKIEEINHDIFLQSGLIDDVYNSIKNIDKLYESLKYNESIEKNVLDLITEVRSIVNNPKFINSLVKGM